MSSETENLWGDILTVQEITPLQILKEQASILTKLTKGILLGEVVESSAKTARENNAFAFVLKIAAPKMNHYIYRVLEIQHSLELYPLQLIDFTTASLARCDCESESHFKDTLRRILASNNVKRVIATLLSGSGVTDIN